MLIGGAELYMAVCRNCYYNTKRYSGEILQFVFLSEFATAPFKATADAVGFDISSAYSYTIKPGERCLCKTDIALMIPDGCYIRVAPRSGLALNKGIHVGGGVIDRDYTGNIGVILFNLGENEFNIQQGDRVAQIICERASYPTLAMLTAMPNNSDKGKHEGFGSTGI